MGTLKRIEARYSGYVQGVGFRFTARRIAQISGVSGYVKNMPDGSVHVVCEGAKEQIDEFLKLMYDEMSDNIRDTNISWHAGTGKFNVFEIAF